MENRLAGGGAGPVLAWKTTAPGWGLGGAAPWKTLVGTALDVAGLSTGEKGEPAPNNSQSRAEFISILILIQS